MITKIARNSVDHLDMVLDAWEKIAEAMPMLIEYQDIFKEHVSLQEVLVEIFADVLEFHQHAIKFFSGRGMNTNTRLGRSLLLLSL